MIGPQMSEVMEALNSGSREKIAEAWRITTSSYEHWVAKQRPGRTSALSRALTLWCRQEAERLCSGDASEEWVAVAEQVQAYCTWVENHCGTKIGDALAKLSETYNTNCGQVQLSALVGMMARWTPGRAASDGDSDSIADAPGSSFKVLIDKLDECEGLTIAEQDATVVGQFLQELAKNIDSREHANVGFMVIKLFPDQDTSSRTAHLDPSAWDHVMCGWDFAALAQSGAASPADESQLALLATKWEEGQTQHMDFTQHRMLQANIDASITSGRNMFAGLVGDRMTAMRDCLSSLEECAGGKTDRWVMEKWFERRQHMGRCSARSRLLLEAQARAGPTAQAFGHRVPGSEDCAKAPGSGKRRVEHHVPPQWRSRRRGQH